MTQGKRRYNRVAVLMGGPSAEHEVSLRSGEAACGGLRACGYEVLPVRLTGREVCLPAGVEAVFIALHGEFGEDGQVQSRLDALGVPYTGSRPEASRRAMDKVLSKQVFETHGIPSPDYRVLRRGESVGAFPLPAVIKPAGQGSSIGLHRVRTSSEWEAAMADAFRHGECVLVEAYIPGRELTVGILERETLPVLEIETPDDWYGYDAKYASSTTRYHCPACLPDAVREDAWRWGLAVFDALGAEGVGRVDMRLSPDGALYVLELNTIPGLTVASLLPKAAAAAGISFNSLCGRLMETARVSPEGDAHGR